MIAHSPTPWRTRMGGVHDGYPQILAANNIQVDMSWPHNPVSQANFEFIVLAANAHNALVKAVRHLLPYALNAQIEIGFSTGPTGDMASVAFDDMQNEIDLDIKQAQDALKLAGEIE